MKRALIAIASVGILAAIVAVDCAKRAGGTGADARLGMVRHGWSGSPRRSVRGRRRQQSRLRLYEALLATRLPQPLGHTRHRGSPTTSTIIGSYLSDHAVGCVGQPKVPDRKVTSHCIAPTPAPTGVGD